MAVLVGWNCCSVTGSCTAASPAGVAAGSVLCSCIGCRSATGRRLVAGDTSVGGGIVSAGYIAIPSPGGEMLFRLSILPLDYYHTTARGMIGRLYIVERSIGISLSRNIDSLLRE